MQRDCHTVSNDSRAAGFQDVFGAGMRAIGTNAVVTVSTHPLVGPSEISLG